MHSGIGMQHRKTRTFYILVILIPEFWIRKRALRTFMEWSEKNCRVRVIVIVAFPARQTRGAAYLGSPGQPQ